MKLLFIAFIIVAGFVGCPNTGGDASGGKDGGNDPYDKDGNNISGAGTGDWRPPAERKEAK